MAKFVCEWCGYKSKNKTEFHDIEDTGISITLICDECYLEAQEQIAVEHGCHECIYDEDYCEHFNEVGEYSKAKGKEKLCQYRVLATKPKEKVKFT